MASALSYRQPVETVLAIVATAAMFYFGNGLEPWWPLMWFAPLPVLLFALRSKWWAAAVTAVAVMMLGNLNMWSYFTKTLRMPGLAWVGIFFAAGAVFAAGVLLFRVLVLNGAAWSGHLALPAVWVPCPLAVLAPDTSNALIWSSEMRRNPWTAC
jgi:apolipoprotein N-acyltransferase